jgi:hypothetical protein
MKARRLDDGTWFVKLEAGDEIVSALTAFVNEQKIYAGSFSAIGACNEAEIGAWDPGRRVYDKTTLKGIIEIVSLLGNVARTEDGKAFVHPHIALGLHDFTMRGGHLFRAIAHPTCEIVLRPYAGAIERRMEDCGLKLWQIS